jgi:hypothetical protein
MSTPSALPGLLLSKLHLRESISSRRIDVA